MIDTELIYNGRCFALYGITVHRKSQVREFIEELDESDQKKILALLTRAADHGVPKNPEKFKHIDGKIFEFKSYQVRILCFFEKDKLIILTNGFIKKKDKTPPEELERAKRLMESYSNRGKTK